jgi:hypothetical protein
MRKLELENECWRRATFEDRFKVEVRIKVKVKGSGRGRPLYAGPHEQAAWGIGGDDVYGEGGAEGICYG